MVTAYQFDGANLFIGEHRHVYPATPGAYWMDQYDQNFKQTDTKVLVLDDFGNLVNGFGSAKQRAHFRQALH